MGLETRDARGMAAEAVGTLHSRLTRPERDLIRSHFAAALCLAAALVLAPPAQAQTALDPASLYAKVIELFNAGNYAEALPYAQRVLSLYEKQPDSLELATALNTLAVLYQKLGRNQDAEPLYKRALAIREKALGAEHPQVMTTVSNLGALYRGMGRLAEAEALFKRSLAFDEKTRGPDHPDVADSLFNLAAIYWVQNRTEAVEPLFKRALAIREKAFGPNHPAVAHTLNNMAGFYRDNGRHERRRAAVQARAGDAGSSTWRRKSRASPPR